MSWITEICGAWGGVLRRMPDVTTHDGDGSDSAPFSERTMHGPLDDVESGMLYRRAQFAEEFKRLFPGWGCCDRCKWPWAVVTGHTVWYQPHSGVFCLCCDCWEELQVPEYRLPYYRMHWERWHADEPWEQLEAAVYAEREVLDQRIQTEINIGWPVQGTKTDMDSHG